VTACSAYLTLDVLLTEIVSAWTDIPKMTAPYTLEHVTQHVNYVQEVIQYMTVLSVSTMHT
jgi:hypothetical protein